MIQNITWGANDPTWYGSIGDGEAIANKLNELRQEMPHEQFTLQSMKSAKDMILYCERKAFIRGGAIVGGSLLLGIGIGCVVDYIGKEHKANKDQQKD